MMKARSILATVTFLTVVLAGLSHGDGVIVIPNPPGPMSLTPLAIKYHHVDVSIDGAVARTSVDQVFHNPNNTELEGLYIFPIPSGSAIDRFTMTIDGKEAEAELLDADKARRLYEDIVRKRRDPALLEYYGRGLLKARVFPIPARGDKRVRISYSEVLKSEAGMTAYRYPLNTEKFSSAPIESVALRVKVDARRPLKTIYSPTHDVDVARTGDRRASVSFEQKDVRPDKDFLLYMLTDPADVGIRVLSYSDGRNDGFFLAMIAPGVEDDEKPLPKDVVFVIDTSGSMQGQKIEQARRALVYCLRSMNPDDRFNLVPFSTEPRPFKHGLMRATKEQVAAAVEFAQGLAARGGTNLCDAVTSSLAVKASDERPFMVVILTDGIPTVGEQDDKKILDIVAKANERRARVFAFGVGHDVNTHLLDELSQENRGLVDYVAPEEDIEVKVSSFYDKIASPVLTEPDLEITGVETHDVYPKELGDVFRGSEILVLGRYRTPAHAQFVLSGKHGRQERVYDYAADLTADDAKLDFLPRLWATRKVGYLLREIRLHGESKELKDEVKRLAKLYGLITPYTSYLILEDEEIQVARGRPAMNIQHLRGAAAPAMAEMSGKTGRHAFNAAKRQSVMARSKAAPAGPVGYGLSDRKAGRAISKISRHVGPLTFYLRGKVWMDSRHIPGATTRKIEFLSDGYFRLLGKHPDIGAALALSDHVIVFADGVSWEIVAR